MYQFCQNHEEIRDDNLWSDLSIYLLKNLYFQNDTFSNSKVNKSCLIKLILIRDDIIINSLYLLTKYQGCFSFMFFSFHFGIEKTTKNLQACLNIFLLLILVFELFSRSFFLSASSLISKFFVTVKGTKQ